MEGERGTPTILTPAEGRIAHAFYLYRPDRKLPYDPIGDSAYDAYLALHTLHEGEAQAATLTFPTQVPPIIKGQIPRYARGQIWYPRFSSDGHHLLFKYGSPTDPEGPNILYVLDTQTKKMRQVPDPPPHTLNYEYITWSPDGNYLAYVIGGNRYGQVNVIHGSGEVYIGPLTLYVVNWRTGKWLRVATNDTLRGPFRWAGAHTLLYGMMPDAQIAPSMPLARPNLYAYSLETQTSRLAMRDGFLPTPSPSGRLVAFFGAENSDAAALQLRKDWPDAPSNVALMIAPLPAAKETVDAAFLTAEPWKAPARRVLTNEPNAFPDVFWLPDEKHLVTLQQTQWGQVDNKTKEFTQLNRAEVRLWDLSAALAGTGKPKSQLVATVSATDFTRAPRSPVDGAFRGLHLSADGKTFYLTTDEYTGIDPLNNILYLNKTTLKAVGVESGQVTDIAQVVGDVGVDWSENTGTPAPTK